MLGVGDVISECHHYAYSRTNSTSTSSHSSGFNITDIPDYVEVCNLIKKYQTDIYADTQYPNDFRPQGNHGYNTKYYPNGGVNPNNFTDRTAIRTLTTITSATHIIIKTMRKITTEIIMQIRRISIPITTATLILRAKIVTLTTAMR